MTQSDSIRAAARTPWGWSFLTLVAAGVVATVVIHLARLPTGARGYYNRGMADTRAGRYEQAVANLDRAIAIDPEWANPLTARATTWNAAGRSWRALADADAAIALDPGWSRAHFVRGVVLSRLGRDDAARDSFARALALDPKFGAAAIALGDRCIDASRYAEALTAYRRARDLRAEDEALAFAPMLVWEAGTLSGDGPGALDELRARAAAVRADRRMLAPWVAAAAGGAGPGATNAGDGVAAWAAAVRAQAAGDRPGAIALFRTARTASSSPEWVRDRAASSAEALAVGLRLEPSNPEISPSFSFGPGLTVGCVREGGAADAAGVRVGDRLVRIDGDEATAARLSAIVETVTPGAEVALELERAGEPYRARLVVGAAITPGGGAPTR